MSANAAVAPPPLPHNLEAEAALLGAMMREPRVIDAVLNTVAADDFFEPVYQRMFMLIADRHSRGEAVGAVLIAPLLANDPAYQAIGGHNHLAQITANLASIIGAQSFSQQIAELAQRRRLIVSLDDILSQARDAGGCSVAELLTSIDASLNATKARDQSVSIVNPGNVADQIAASMGKEIHGVTSHMLEPANRALGKLRPGNVIVIAGRPGMGKSAFATSYSLGAAMNGHGVLFASLEMSEEELTERMLADLCYRDDIGVGVPFELIRQRRIPAHADDEWAMFDAARRRLNELPIRIVKTPGLTVGRLGAIARQTARRFEASGSKLDLLVIDYLQLMRAGKRAENRVQEVSEITREVKILAGQLNVPVILLSQLSREVEKREDKRPMLSDLRDSGSIEQDADTVGFLFRPEYYVQMAEPERDTPKHEEWQDRMNAVRNVVEIIAAKVRHGRTGTQDARFYGQYQAMRGRRQ